MFIKNILFASACFFALSASAQYYPYYPAPNPYYAPAPYPGMCPYEQSSVCHTYSGQTCTLFAVNNQTSWFSTCLYNGPFYACLNLPSVPLVQNVCYPKTSPCTCFFGQLNGFYMYEPGQIF